MKTSQSSSQICRKKSKMTNIFLTDYDEEVMVNFVKDHDELYDKTNELFKNKSRKYSLWESFARRHKLSIQTCKTWFKSQRTHHSKLTQSISGQAPKEPTDRQHWIHDLSFTSEGMALASPWGSSHHTEDPVPVAVRPAFPPTHTSHPLPALPVPV